MFNCSTLAERCLLVFKCTFKKPFVVFGIYAIIVLIIQELGDSCTFLFCLSRVVRWYVLKAHTGALSPGFVVLIVWSVLHQLPCSLMFWKRQNLSVLFIRSSYQIKLFILIAPSWYTGTHLISVINCITCVGHCKRVCSFGEFAPFAFFLVGDYLTEPARGSPVRRGSKFDRYWSTCSEDTRVRLPGLLKRHQSFSLT